jgi:hypothetical protein
MHKTTSFQKVLVAAGFAVMALHANAVTFTSVAATAGDYVAPTFLVGSTGTVATSSSAAGLAPLFATGSFGVVSPDQFATIDLGMGSYTFLWGSPDPTNSITIGAVSYFASDVNVLGAFADSNNANSRLVTISGFDDGAIATLKTGQIAFEVAVPSPVPEPETYALMLAGLGVVGFMARRRKAD